MNTHELEEIYNYIKLRNIIVPKDEWMAILDSYIDDSPCIGVAVNQLYKYLSLNYTASIGGKVSLEPMDAVDLQNYKNWFIDIYEDLDEYESAEDLLDELNYTPFVVSNAILEVYVDPIQMSNSQLQTYIRNANDPDWENRLNALRNFRRHSDSRYL